MPVTVCPLSPPSDSVCRSELLRYRRWTNAFEPRGMNMRRKDGGKRVATREVNPQIFGQALKNAIDAVSALAGSGAHAGAPPTGRKPLPRQSAFPKNIDARVLFLHNVPMKAVNIRELKNNPSEAVRAAKAQPVVVLNRDTPEVVMVLANDPDLERLGARVALAVALYRDDAVSLSKGARIAAIPLEDFMAHVSARGLPVIKGSAGTLQEELENLAQWRKQQSSPTPGR